MNVYFCIEGNEDLKAVNLSTAPHKGDKIKLNFCDYQNEFFDGTYEVVDAVRQVDILQKGMAFDSCRCILRPVIERRTVLC